jgi:hypothetical protein
VTSTGLSSLAWLRPTRRAIEWTPLALVTAAILVTSSIFGWRAVEVPLIIRFLGVAGLAAAAVLGLGDTARALLQALPTPPLTRLGHRVLLLAGATALAVTAIGASGRLLGSSPTAEPELAGALIALAAVGIAVHSSLSSTVDHAEEAAAGVILLWVAAAALPLTSLAVPVSMAWLHRPSIVTAAAGAVTLFATRRGA